MYIFLPVLFPWLTVDLLMAFYGCHNKLTFKGAQVLPVEVFDSCAVTDQLK